MHAAGGMLIDSGLSSKEGITTQKAGKLRALAERTGWGVNPNEHEKKSFGKKRLTIREQLMSECKWYYPFEQILHKHPNITSPYIEESGQPGRDHGMAANDEPNEEEKHRGETDGAKEEKNMTVGADLFEKNSS